MMKNILVVGGTGTLGQEIVKRFYERGGFITVLSRDELKQQQMKRKYPDNIEYLIGDISRSDVGDVFNHRTHYDVIFHCAALKHVDVGEENVAAFMRTNFNGVMHMHRCFNDPATKFVFFSTDKAVLPINAYGMTKALAEKYLQSVRKSAAIYRWGNILGSRGSVVKSFADAIANDNPVFITDSRMTRFWLTIENCVDFVMGTYENAFADTIMIPDVKAASVLDLVRVIADIMGKSRTTEKNIKYVGIRPGEKIHECLFSSHTHCLTSDNAEKWDLDHLTIVLRPILRSMGYL